MESCADDMGDMAKHVRHAYMRENRDKVIAHEVKRIMVAEVAAATSGSTPRWSMRGPFTMPPPTPNMPAMTPAPEHIRGY